jgi:hypothetical protein
LASSCPNIRARYCCRCQFEQFAIFGNASVEVRTINPNLTFHHFLIPKVLAGCKQLSPGEKLCYAVLGDCARGRDFCWPSRRFLAAAMGVSEVQVKRYIGSLVKKRFIRRIARHGHSNRYVFLWHPFFEGKTDRPGSDVTRTRVECDPPPGSGMTLRSNQREVINGTIERASSLKTPTSSREHARRMATATRRTTHPSTFGEKRLDYLLSEAAKTGAPSLPSDVNRLSELVAEFTKSRFDRKVVRSILARLENRGLSLDQYFETIGPHLKRLDGRVGPGFFYDHAKTFEPDDHIPPAAPAAAPPPPPKCARCSDHGMVGDLTGTEFIPGMAAAVVAGRAAFCGCENGRISRELCSEHLPRTKEKKKRA